MNKLITIISLTLVSFGIFAADSDGTGTPDNQESNIFTYCNFESIMADSDGTGKKDTTKADSDGTGKTNGSDTDKLFLYFECIKALTK